MMTLLQAFWSWLKRFLESPDFPSIQEKTKSGAEDRGTARKSRRPRTKREKQGNHDPVVSDELETKREKIQDHRSSMAEKGETERPSGSKSGRAPAIQARKEKIFVQAGVDLGTSSTKAAFRILGAKNKVHPILFKTKDKIDYPPCCLPTLAAFNEARELLLGTNAARYLLNKQWDYGLRRFKVLVASQKDNTLKDQFTEDCYKNYVEQHAPREINCSPEVICAAFLSHAFRLVRNQIKSILSSETMDIAFNVSIPIDYVENNEVFLDFKRVLAVAESVERDWEGDLENNDVLSMIMEGLSKGEYENGPNTRVFGVPEAVAEVASYLESLEAKDGLHAVIDFGSGTTDISIFNLRNIRATKTCSYWYAAKNLPYGTYRIEKLISTLLKGSSKAASVTEAKVRERLTQLNTQPSELSERVHLELEKMWEETIPVWRSAYGHLKKQSEWEKDKVQVFVCGGGAGLPFIRKIFSQSWMPGWGPYPLRHIPEPHGYTSEKTAPFQRISVAYGLTVPIPELNKFVLPRDAPIEKPFEFPVREIAWWDEPMPTQSWLSRKM